ncbi:Crp/Fnr family transcriptional regulator [Methylobrevis albus]|uniref:Crp/Fnr family transcriptional regulator n=1 Tax=Methylobrevis albus TaxID=2793297 RepID=A0A931N0W1_9HYPH|nr:Crp/Fnr family transcriptional regulator [Methylobrevis albus]MBH0239649.1 Crp/Fnr family transcriptional regulator [Methylobrevis albus]
MTGEIEAVLRQQALFAGAGDDDIARLAAAARRRSWSAGTMLFQRGDPGQDLILVTAGRIRLSILSADGRELGLRHAEAGASLGELAVLDGSPRSADATAVTESAGLVIARADLDRITAERPAILRSCIAYLCARLRDTTDQMESIALYRLEARLARMLLALARAQKAGDSGTVTIELPLSQSEIADMIGATRPRVNGAFAALEDAGALKRTGAAVVCRLAVLRAIGEGGGA